MSTTTQVKQKVLGAQRLYNAIKQGNVGFVGMFMLSCVDNKEVAQPFNIRKVWDAWQEAPDADMLRVLLNCENLKHGYYISRQHNRYDRTVNYSIRKQLLTIKGLESPPIDILNNIKNCANVLQEHSQELSGDVMVILNDEATKQSWPYAIIEAHSESLNSFLADSIQHQRDSDINWCVENIKNFSKSIGMNRLLHIIVEHKRFDVFTRLAVTEEEQKELCKEYELRECIQKARKGREMYEILDREMPWVGKL